MPGGVTFEEASAPKEEGVTFEEANQPAGLSFEQAQGLSFEEASGEPRNTYEKAVQSAAGAAARTVATLGIGLSRLEDIGQPNLKQRFGQHEAAMIRAGGEEVPYERALSEIEAGRNQVRQQLMMPGETMARTAAEAAKASEDTAAATPGNPWVAKASELAGGMAPVLLAGPLAPAAGGLSSAGATYQQAFEYYRSQGFDEERAKQLADRVAATTGLATGAIFAALPGFGKAAAEKLMADRLVKANPVVRAAVNTLAASGQGGLVMGADSLVRNAQAKLTYRPELTWQQALVEAANEALAGAAGTALVHGPMEAAGEAWRGYRAERATPGNEGNEGRSVSEFGGETELVQTSEPEPAASETPRTAKPSGQSQEAPPAENGSVPFRILQGQLRQALAARQAIPASWLQELEVAPEALPEGYALKAGRYEFEAPAPKLTAEQEAVRENTQAMEELRQQKAASAAAAAEDPDWTVPDEDAATRPTERPEAGTPMEWGERPPDILDWIEGNFNRVRPTSKADYGDYVRAARGRAKELLSLERGESTDLVMQEMHAQGMFPGLQTEDDLLHAMVRAGEARIAWREAQTKARKGIVTGSAAEDWANEVLQGGATHAGPDVLAAYVIKGAATLERGARAFATWSAEMLRQFGEELRPHLEDIWRRTLDLTRQRGIVFASHDLKGLRAAKEEWLRNGATEAGAHDLVDRFYRSEKYADLEGTNPIYVAVPSTSGRNLLPRVLAERLAQDYGGQVFEGAPAIAAAAKESKAKTNFWSKIEDLVQYAEGPDLDRLVARSQGRRVVIVEDAHNTGESWLRFQDRLEEAGVPVASAVALAGSDTRWATPRDLERLSEKLSQATGQTLDRVKALVDHEFRGNTKQWLNYAERAASSKTAAARLIAALDSRSRGEGPREAASGAATRGVQRPDATSAPGTSGLTIRETTGSEATLDGVADHLYGKPYEELTPDQQGNVRITVEAENRPLEKLQRREQAELERPVGEHRTDRGDQTAPAGEEPRGELQPSRPTAKPEKLSAVPQDSPITDKQKLAIVEALSRLHDRSQTEIEKLGRKKDRAAGGKQDVQGQISYEIGRAATMLDALEAIRDNNFERVASAYERYKADLAEYRREHIHGYAKTGRASELAMERRLAGERDALDQIQTVLKAAQSVYDLEPGGQMRLLERPIESRGAAGGNLSTLGFLDPANYRPAFEFGKELAGRVKDFVAWSAEMVKQFGEAIRPHLRDLWNKIGERETGLKIQASAAVSDQTKQAITEYLYERRSNATDDELAAGIVQQHGIDGAIGALRNPPANLPASVHSRLLGLVTRMLGEQERAARQGQNFEAAHALARKAGALWDEMLPRITEMAQGLQALNDLVELSPDAQVARTQQRLERAANEELDRHADELTQMRNAIETGRAAGVEDVRRDDQVNGAARAAVDQAVANNGEVHKAVIMELAGPWSESTEIVRMAREQVRAKADEILNRNPTPKGLSASQHLRGILDDLAKRAATIAAGYFQGASSHAQGLKGLFMERLGLDDAHAGRLAKGMEDEFQRQVKAAQEKLPKRIAAQRVARDRQAAGALPQGAEATVSAVDAAIRRQLRLLNQHLGNVLRQEAGRRELTGAHVADRVVQASGLTGEAADRLRTVLRNRWDALVTDAQRRALEGLQKRTGVKVSPRYRQAFDKALELDRLGALSSPQFFELVKKALKLRRLTDADAKELRRLAAHMQDQPEGFLRQRAAAEVLKFTEKLSDNRRWWDVPMAIFYANILSGITTPTKIALENTNLLVFNTVANWLSRPGELVRPLDFGRAMAGAYKRGLTKGVLQGADTLRTGVVSGVWATPKRPSVLESQPFGPKWEPLNFWKYFGRVIGASHELTFKPAFELKQTLIARELARREGLRGRELQKRVADLMANTEERFAAARAQALRELPGGRVDDIARRAREIIEQQRELNMPGVTETARDFALRTAYLNEPYGFMGKVAIGVRSLLEQLRRDHPWLGTGVKSQIPFTTIVANILNEKLNWTPVGLLRAYASRRSGELYGRKILDSNERAELYTKAIVGTIALGVLGEAFGHLIHGNGPSDPHKRKQLQSAGWIPHSIELGGKYYSYMNTPLAVGLAIIGNYKDWLRYDKGDEADAVARAAFVTKGTANAIISQGMLDSVKRLFEALGSESTSEGGKQLQKLTARTGASFVFPSLLQQTDRMFDPTQYDQSGITALLQSQVPFARRLGRPVLNALGEPVQQSPFHYWASQKSQDPVWRLIADKGAFISAPNKNQVLTWDVGQNKWRAVTDDEYYEFVKQSGPKIHKFILDNLNALQAMPPDMLKRELRAVAEGYHKAARWSVQTSPE